mmetsp:Transcript_51305/g.111712  ORF Transcript_51305/g.111712 Transcript_51305/m.111712 type:complete len:207 (-) Transcript_51305:231-851(-)
MIRDIGLDDHDLPSFTRCASRAEGRLRATEHLMSCPQSVSAILIFKAFTCHGRKTTIPGYFLNHFARRLCEDHLRLGQSPLTSSTLFCAMVETFLAFCGYQDHHGWVAYPASGSDGHMNSPTGPKMQVDLPPRCEILWDLWQDLCDYDHAHPGSNWANRAHRAFGLARHMLLQVLAARIEDNHEFFRNHSALYRCPASNQVLDDFF